MTAEPSDRRRAPRHLAVSPTGVERPLGEQEVSLIRDISTTGALLLTSLPFEVGERLLFELRLDAESGRTAHVGGVVIRCTSHSDPTDKWRFAVGVEFERTLEEWEPEITRLGRQSPQLPLSEG